MSTNMWLDGMMGLIVGDALGCPVQFLSREEIEARGLVTGMEGYGTYHMPAGTWTDDGSMALASLDSLVQCKRPDPDDTMKKFAAWIFEGAYTQYGQAFDQGMTCTEAIYNYERTGDWKTCGRKGEHANGNGALMRILPVCLYFIARKKHACTSSDEVIYEIHTMASLTHHHLRSNMACGLYYYLAKAIAGHRDLGLRACLQRGFDEGFSYYGRGIENLAQRQYYRRLFDLQAFAATDSSEIRSSGYVVDSFEAAIWCLMNTESFKECLLKAVNLGNDTDTVAAIAGGLAGLYYGVEAIPAEWLDAIQKKEYVMELCRKADEVDFHAVNAAGSSPDADAFARGRKL